MAEAIGLVASIIAILELSSKAVDFLSKLKHASEERLQLQREFVSITGLLTVLRTKSDEWKNESWSETVKLLESPLLQTRVVMERVLPKLEQGTGMKKLGMQLIWPFQKAEVLDIITSLERYQRYFLLALQNDHVELSREIQSDVKEIRTELREVSMGVKNLNEGVTTVQQGVHRVRGELSGAREDIQEVRKGVLELRHDQQSMLRFETAQELRAQEQQRKEIIDWISPLNFAAKQKEVLNTRQEGTGKWLLEHPLFQEWMQGTHNILFLPGIPGGGKTVLASSVVNHLVRSNEKQSNNTVVAFVYCNYKEERHTASNLMGSILQQVASRESTAFPKQLHKEFIELHTQYVNKYLETKERPPVNDFTNILKERLPSFSRTYIVVDALDECLEWEILQEEIKSLATENVSVLITSRHIKGIEELFGAEAKIPISASDLDVRAFLKGQIMKKQRLAVHAGKDVTLTKQIIDTIAIKTQGMFLLAQLHIDTLGSKHTVRKMREALESLPQGLDDTYNNAIERIAAQGPEDFELARQVFCWITYARNPLTIAQLQHAIAIERGMTELDDEDVLREETLVALCAGLIKFDPVGNRVRLVHYTTQEFFERNGVRLFPNAHTNLAVTCMTYLLFKEFDTAVYKERHMRERIKKYPFLEYAATYWGDHAREASGEGINDLIIQLLESEGKLMPRFQVVRWRLQGKKALDSSQEKAEEYKRDLHKLLVAAWFGLEQFVRKYIEEGVDMNTKSGSGLTAISIAARRGLESIARMLLAQKDIQLNTVDTRLGRTPLAWAVAFRHNNIVQLLLTRRDAQPLTAVGTLKNSPIALAVRSHNEIAVRLLLTEENILPATGGDFLKLLLTAVHLENLEIASLIIHHKSVNPNILIDDYRTLFDLAIAMNDEAFANLLLTEVIDLDKKSKYIGRFTSTLLALAISMASIAIVRRLLTCGKPIDVNAHSPLDTKQPLICFAMDKGRFTAAELLLEHPNINLNLVDHEGHNVLDYVLLRTRNIGGEYGSDYGDQLARKILIAQHDLPMNSRCGEFHLKLDWNSRPIDFERLASIFLSIEEINPDWLDSSGRTLMCQAACDGRTEVVKKLLGRDDVNPNLPSKDGCSPLTCASIYGHIEVAQLLLERKDVELDPMDPSGQTPLSWAARNGHEEIVALLLTRGCKADPRDNEGRTPLSRAAEKGHVGVVRLLLSQPGLEVDVSSCDNSIRTPLSWAAEVGNRDVVRLLLTREDVDVDMVTGDGHGQTALGVAVLNGHEDVAELLRQSTGSRLG